MPATSVSAIRRAIQARVEAVVPGSEHLQGFPASLRFRHVAARIEGDARTLGTTQGHLLFSVQPADEGSEWQYRARGDDSDVHTTFEVALRYRVRGVASKTSDMDSARDLADTVLRAVADTDEDGTDWTVAEPITVSGPRLGPDDDYVIHFLAFEIHHKFEWSA